MECFTKYFTKATVYGIDINDRIPDQIKSNPRIQFTHGDALKYDILDKFPFRFDIIVEDASHTLQDQIQHFIDFGHKVNHGGLYVIEDVHQDNMERLISATQRLYKRYRFRHDVDDIGSYGFHSMEVVDLRPIKNRFDDIMLIFKKYT